MANDTSDEDVNYAIQEFPQIITRLREISPYAKGWGGQEES
jgi:hypothetical protein